VIILKESNRNFSLCTCLLFNNTYGFLVTCLLETLSCFYVHDLLYKLFQEVIALQKGPSLLKAASRLSPHYPRQIRRGVGAQCEGGQIPAHMGQAGCISTTH
jgi:hypothetical protein